MELEPEVDRWRSELTDEDFGHVAFEGVRLDGKRSILTQLTAPGPADVGQVRAIARAIALALPAK